MFKLTIYVEMMDGQNYIYRMQCEKFSEETIESFIAEQTNLRGDKFGNVYDYKVVITNAI